jgi:hypothetical protein
MNKLPSSKSLVVWAGAIALAFWSLPQAPDVPVTSRYRQHTVHHMNGAIPALTQSTPDALAQNTPAQSGGTVPAPPSLGKPAVPPPSTNVTPPGAGTPPTTPSVPGQPSTLPSPSSTSNQFTPYAPWPTAQLRLRVIDGRTQKPLAGAEVVIIETEQRLTTDPDGYTTWANVPIIRNPRYRPMVAELHGQLGVIAYKNGYRDSVHLGIRMHDGVKSESTVWMYKLGPGDTRIEPVLYQVPYHHLWLIELADKFRSKTQPGEGPQQP